MVEYILVFLAAFGIVLSIVLNELVLNNEIDQDKESQLLWYIMASTIALVIALFIRYDHYVQWYKSRKILSDFDSIFSAGWWQNLVLEQGICVIAPYPFFQGANYIEVNTNWNVTVSYSMNQILMCMSFARVYILLRYVLFVSRFMNPRSHRVCQMVGCEANHMFAVKSIMKEIPYKFIFVTLALSIALFGYQLKVFEGPLSDASNQNFNLFSNCMWNVIITLTTTGYGEFYPKSLFGRFIGLIICFWGTLMTSFFVVTVNNMLTFTPSEEKSFNILQRLRFKEELKEYAANVLSASYRHRKLKKESKKDSVIMRAFKHMRNNMLSFSQAVERVRRYYDGETELEIFQKQIDVLFDEVKGVSEDQGKTKEGIDKVTQLLESLHSYLTEQKNKNQDSKRQSKTSSIVSPSTMSNRAVRNHPTYIPSKFKNQKKRMTIIKEEEDKEEGSCENSGIYY